MFFAMLVTLSVSAQNAWTVEKVPNTRIQGNFIHVSDPDGYISADTEKRINTALSAIQDTADVFIVALNSIGYEDPQMFRTELFQKWGIGDKNKDNGMLLLFVEDQHALEFETGYGIEPVMTDAKCFEIFNHTIIPYFKKGDYEGGLYAGVLDIVNVFGGTLPAKLVETLPDEEVYNSAIAERDKETMSAFYLLTIFILCFCVPIISAVRFLYQWTKDKYTRNTEIKDTYTIKEIDGVSYIYDFKNTWTGSAWQGNGCSRVLTFGLSSFVWFLVCSTLLTLAMKGEEEIYINNWIATVTIVTYLTWICWRHNVRTLKMAVKVAKGSLCPKMVFKMAKNHRKTVILNGFVPWIGISYNKKYDQLINANPEMQCPTCHSTMTQCDDVLFSDKQAFEIINNIRIYTSLHCPQGHVFVKVDNGANYNKYNDCQKCGVRAMKKIKHVVIEKPTYYKSGVDEITNVCQFCGEEQKIRVTTPKLVRTVSSGSSYYGGSSRGWSGSSGSSGSFGGGRSGGGGFSGRW